MIETSNPVEDIVRDSAIGMRFLSIAVLAVVTACGPRGDSVSPDDPVVFVPPDGKMVGNFTVRPLFKQMPAAEVERLKSMLADP